MKFGKLFSKGNLVKGGLGFLAGVGATLVAGMLMQDEEGADNNEVLVDGEPDPVIEAEEQE